MKIILSRKGFDSSFGGVPSPVILPERELFSLPIPTDSSSGIRYEDIDANGRSLGPVVEDLTGGKVKRTCFAHLDPDLRASARPRHPEWRPLFGQADAAQAHLRNNGITVGDLFLFFGWFREAECLNGKYCFVKNAPDVHAIYGWLQIGEILPVGNKASAPPWAAYHHHFKPPNAWRNNTVYVSSAKLVLNGVDEEIRGAGVFEKYRAELCLTCPNQSKRSLWMLPKWFYPDGDLPPLSYHGNKTRWKLEGEHAIMRSVGRGQEFALDADKYPEAVIWARDLILGDAG